MKLFLLLPFILLLIAAPWHPPLARDLRQDATPIAITSPAPDEVLRDQITITGRVDIVSFVSVQLDFGYASNPTNTWFTIQTFSQPIVDSTLAVWDTTPITDGDYILRLRVNLEDGTFQEVAVPIKIGNDALLMLTPTPEPTATPKPGSDFVPTPFLLAASPTPTDLPRSTPTTLPMNPASLERNEIYASLGRGALVILGLFALAGLIIRVRRF
jgi:hypothetical protein